MRRKLFVCCFILAGFACAAVSRAQKPDASYPISDKQFQQLIQFQQSEINWRVAQELLNELTPDKDAPCDKRIREQVATRHQLALSIGESFMLKLRAELNVPKDYILADDGKSFKVPSKP